MREEITRIVLAAYTALAEDMGLELEANPNEETRLYGVKSGLDSIALVNLIADIEDRISSELGKDIVLADERAMSQTRSPFRRVGSLVDYIETLLKEGGQ